MSFAGTWNVVMKTPMGDREVVMVIEQDGEALSGTMTADDNAVPMKDGQVDGERATWKADLTQPMPITLEFDCGLDGDALDGTVKLGMFGNSGMSGTRA